MATETQRAKLFNRVDHATELPMLVIALVFALIMLLLAFGDLPAEVDQTLESITWLIWGLFAFELILKTYLAPNRRRYLTTHWADVLTVLVPAFRPLRLLQVAVAGARFWRNADELIRHRTFSILGISTLCAIGTAGVLMYAVERRAESPIQTLPDAFWWAAATITTVGYGDVYPRTPAGRGIAVVLMLVGISLFGLLTARVAAFFVHDENAGANAEKLEEVRLRLQHIENVLQQRGSRRSVWQTRSRRRGKASSHAENHRREASRRTSTALS